MENVSVKFLGNFQITIDNQPLEGIESAKAQSLLVCLFFHPFISYSRRQIACRLWPESSESQAMANLRNLLFSLRRTFPRMVQILDVQPHSIQLCSGLVYQMDVHEFEKSGALLNSIPDLQKAIFIYGGELLPGFYDDWIQDQRDRLHSAYVQTLERLVQLFEQNRVNDPSDFTILASGTYPPVREYRIKHHV
jgi:DNA-binding SARP family transcriptional activator